MPEWVTTHRRKWLVSGWILLGVTVASIPALLLTVFFVPGVAALPLAIGLSLRVAGADFVGRAVRTVLWTGVLVPFAALTAVVFALAFLGPVNVTLTDEGPFTLLTAFLMVPPAVAGTAAALILLRRIGTRVDTLIGRGLVAAAIASTVLLTVGLVTPGGFVTGDLWRAAGGLSALAAGILAMMTYRRLWTPVLVARPEPSSETDAWGQLRVG